MADASGFLIPLWAVIIGWVVAAGSPGPATLSISGTSMALGRKAGLKVALGVVVGSACWGIAAGVGLSAVMLANAWMLEFVRYAGALYLLYLAAKSLKSAWRANYRSQDATSPSTLFIKGLLLHLTNPKAIFAWGSIYAIVLAPSAGQPAVWQLFATLISASAVVFIGYALLFSVSPISRLYARSRRWFELSFGLLFGAASLKILTVRLT